MARKIQLVMVALLGLMVLNMVTAEIYGFDRDGPLGYNKPIATLRVKGFSNYVTVCSYGRNMGSLRSNLRINPWKVAEVKLDYLPVTIRCQSPNVNGAIEFQSNKICILAGFNGVMEEGAFNQDCV